VVLSYAVLEKHLIPERGKLLRSGATNQELGKPILAGFLEPLGELVISSLSVNETANYIES
jgi:hypothetical protein